MRRFHILLIFLALAIAPQAQTRKTTTAKKTQTSKTAKKKKTTTKKKQSQKEISTPSIKGLKNEREQIKKQIAAQQKKLRNNERDVKQRLQNLMVINTEIADKRKTIDTIRRDINVLDGNIGQLNDQIVQLQKELDDRKAKYVKSMRYMHRNRSIQNQLMFIFSAKNFTQMYRRMRFMREYASYQKVQGEMVKTKQAEVTAKHEQLTRVKQQKHTLLYKGEQERRNLESKQAEQQTVVTSLQKQQKTIKSIIDKQMERDKAINAEIDRLVAIEVEKARQRAIAEAKRKAEELARKKAAAEAAARENARRVALAKEREARLKREAEAAARKSAEEKALAEAAAREAKRVREETERRAAEEKKAHEREVAEAKKAKEEAPKLTLASEDRRISGSFESNRGRLPMPVAGSYRIVSHFGQYNVEGLKNVRLDNKGINILGNPGAVVRSIFDGEVSAVFSFGGTTGVMVRHGSYISVYCNLGSVSVRKGQKVTTRQTIGTVGRDNILQFQLRRERSKLNPEAWLGR